MHDPAPDLDPIFWQGVLRGLDYLGTTVFTISGTITAGQAGMDLLGERGPFGFNDWERTACLTRAGLANTDRPQRRQPRNER